MNEILGNNVLLEVYSTLINEYVPYKCCKDVSIAISPELINTTTVSSGKWNTYKERRRDWEVTLNGVTTIEPDGGRVVFTTVANGNLGAVYAIRLTFDDLQGNDAVFTGNALLKSANISGDQNNFSEFDNNFQGTGPYVLLVNGTGGTGPIKLQTPPNFTATAVSSSQINLSWVDVAHESNYKIYWNGINNFGSAAVLTSPVANATSYSHTGLGALSTFYYWIVAIGDGTFYLDSDPSPVTFATTWAAVSMATIYYGWNDTGTIIEAAIPSLQFSASIVHNADITADYRTNAVPKFLIMAEPSTETVKTKWFGDPLNNGIIDTDLFIKSTVGAYRVYISQYATFNTDTTIQFLKV